MSTHNNVPTEVTHSVSARKRVALTALCLQVLPIWGRQLATSRLQAEVAVGEMLKAFSTLAPNLEAAIKQSKQIIEALVPSNGEVGMRGLVAACEQEMRPLIQTLGESGAQPLIRALELIRKSVSTLDQVTNPLPFDAQQVAEKIEQMYVGFQYQDRVNQMMSLLQDDIAHLQAILESPETDHDALAADAWLKRLESMYAMHEQRQAHGTSEAEKDQQPSKEASFF
jgi:hypothetical protein